MINDPQLVVLFDVSGGVDESATRSYSRRFFAGMRTLGAELPDDLDNLPHVKLSLVNRQAALAALPADIVAQLMKQERCLLAGFHLFKQLPPGETLISSHCEVLAEPFDCCPTGTVVVVRQTDAATMGFLCPQLRIDPGTGTLSTAENPLLSRLPAATAPPSAGQPTVLAAKEGAVDYIEIGLQTASVLAFALPPPFGIVVPGLLTFLSGIFGLAKTGQEHPNPFTALDQKLKNENMADWMTAAGSLVDYVNRQMGLMATAPPTPKQVVQDHAWIGALDSYITPGQGNLFTYLRQIQNLDDFISNQNRFFALMTCVNVYLFGVKWKIFLKAWIASEYKKQNDAENFLEYNRQWRSDYGGWVEDILGGPNFTGWVPRVNKLIDDRIAYRLGQISGVQSVNKDYFPPTEHGQQPVVQHSHYSFFTDRGDEVNSGERRFKDEMDSQDQLKVSHYQDAVNARTAHYNAVAEQQRNLYAQARELTQRWTDSINQWNSHLPPGRPIGVPSVDASSWQRPAPSDSVWAKHADDSVSYAIDFYNQPDQGDQLNKPPKPGPIGDWSDPVEIDGGCAPHLMNVPVDAIQLATGRHIYRKFISRDGKSSIKLVGMIPDNTTKTYIDV